jgi:hypothetical protein
MSKESKSAPWTSLGKVAIVLLVFVLGVAGGVGLERFWLGPAAQPKPDNRPLKERLLGIWVSENGSRAEFKSDGTFDELFREIVPDLKPGQIIDDPSKLKMVERDARISGQYEWVEEDKIQIKVQNRPTRKVRIAAEGDSLTILEEDGKVSRLKRIK